MQEQCGKKGTLAKKECCELAASLLFGVAAADIERRYDKFESGKVIFHSTHTSLLKVFLFLISDLILQTMNSSTFLGFFKSMKPTAPNELQVVVVKAENLISANGTMFGGIGSSDPYVELKIGNFSKFYISQFYCVLFKMHVPLNLNRRSIQANSCDRHKRESLFQ